ncbi:MAG: hypothetical protein ACR65U_14440 [Methylocystis sp.]
MTPEERYTAASQANHDSFVALLDALDAYETANQATVEAIARADRLELQLVELQGRYDAALGQFSDYLDAQRQRFDERSASLASRASGKST